MILIYCEILIETEENLSLSHFPGHSQNESQSDGPQAEQAQIKPE